MKACASNWRNFYTLITNGQRRAEPNLRGSTGVRNTTPQRRWVCWRPESTSADGPPALWRFGYGHGYATSRRLGTRIDHPSLASYGADNQAASPMPKKIKRKRQSSTLSGVAATLVPFRDKVAPLDTPEDRRKAGELIARAVRSRKRLSSRKVIKSA